MSIRNDIVRTWFKAKRVPQSSNTAVKDQRAAERNLFPRRRRAYRRANAQWVVRSALYI